MVTALSDGLTLAVVVFDTQLEPDTDRLTVGVGDTRALGVNDRNAVELAVTLFVAVVVRSPVTETTGDVVTTAIVVAVTIAVPVSSVVPVGGTPDSVAGVEGLTAREADADVVAVAVAEPVAVPVAVKSPDGVTGIVGVGASVKVGNNVILLTDVLDTTGVRESVAGALCVLVPSGDEESLG